MGASFSSLFGHDHGVASGSDNTVQLSGAPGPEMNNLGSGAMNPAFESSEHINAAPPLTPPTMGRPRQMSVVDPAPKIDHYRLAKDVITRPSLQDLHQEKQPIPDYILDSLVDMEKVLGLGWLWYHMDDGYVSDGRRDLGAAAEAGSSSCEGTPEGSACEVWMDCGSLGRYYVDVGASWMHLHSPVFVRYDAS